ncbi:MAG: transcriptional repressor NrdR [Deltaproteobacteria bacterium]|nr:MAG: transcriptional repressor NrdR [Deltaproteobacteria bacterium]
MRCPACQHEDSKVVDSRTSGDSIRRRRECLACNERFTTHERVEAPTLWVLKKDGRKEPFSAEKVLAGLALACRKRPVTAQAMDEAVKSVHTMLQDRRGTEVPAAAVGEAVMEVLRGVDEVAYIRFASVYREFESADQFIETIQPLQERLNKDAS